MAAKKQTKWSAEEDATIIDLRSRRMKWDDISKHLDGRSAISCRLHYQNYLERRCEWSEESKNKLARLYDRFKLEMWETVAKELRLPVRAVEKMHWRLGEQEMLKRAGASQFTPLDHQNQPEGAPRGAQNYSRYSPIGDYGQTRSQRRSASSGTEPLHPSNGSSSYQEHGYGVPSATHGYGVPLATSGYGVPYPSDAGHPPQAYHYSTNTTQQHQSSAYYGRYSRLDEQDTLSTERDMLRIAPIQLSPERSSHPSLLPGFKELSTAADFLSTPSYAFASGVPPHYTSGPGPLNGNMGRSLSPARLSSSSAVSYPAAPGPSSAVRYISTQGPYSSKRRASPEDGIRASRRPRRRSPVN